MYKRQGFDFGSLMPGAGPFAGGTDDVKKEKLFPMRSVEYLSLIHISEPTRPY